MRQRLTAPRLLTLILAAIVFSGAHAAQVQGLYEAVVPVPSKDEAERSYAFGAALRIVIVKITGDRSPQRYPGVVQAMSRPAPYVEQFGYRIVTLESLGEGSLAAEQLVLWARFDADGVDALMREVGLPAWGHTRPSVLLWLAAEDETGRSLIGADDRPGITNVLEATAAKRGLPLVFPLLDLEDRSRLAVEDILAGFEDRIARASARYQPDITLIVRLYRLASGIWEARWRMFMEGAPHDWTTRSEALDLMLEEGLDGATDIVAGRFARNVEAAGESGVAVEVEEVRTVEDYARTLVYLQSLDGVTRVDVTGVDVERVSFLLQARGGDAALQQLIALERTLGLLDSRAGMRFRLLR